MDLNNQKMTNHLPSPVRLIKHYIYIVLYNFQNADYK